MVYLLALVIGLIAGLRTMTAPAAMSWAAYLGYLNLDGSWLAFMGYRFTPWILSVLALGEFVTDQLPATPSRKVPIQFGARLVSGALSGAMIGVHGGTLLGGLMAGIVGAVMGTLGGAAVRSRLAAALGRDLPAGLIEDAIAIIGAISVVGIL
ncbi:membrane protein [Calothrix sp. 336/3]|nr:membrane protein [Calothrix sp. 336/3]